jgi:hypothetical protein
MNKPFLVLLALSTSGLCAGTAVAAEPTSSAQRAEMIRLINGLEKKPYGPDADNSRKVVMDWLTEAPDVTVNVCGALLGDIDDLEGEKDDPGLLLQLMFAEARLILEHPEQAGDDKAVHTAGVEGVLAFYAAMKAEKPGVKIAPIEKIAKARADGKLPEFIDKAIAKCN